MKSMKSLFLHTVYLCRKVLPLLALAGLLLAGCKELPFDASPASLPGALPSSGYCSFRLSLTSPQARAVVPAYSLSAYYYSFSAVDSSGTTTVYPEDGSLADYSSFIGKTFTFATGSYTFTVKAYSEETDGLLVLQKSLAETLSETTTGLSFTLAAPSSSESEAGSGSVSVTLSYPVETYPAVCNITAVTANLYALSDTSTAIATGSLSPQDAGDGMYTVTFSKESLSAGTYILDFAFTNYDYNTDSYDVVHIPLMVKVASGVESQPDSDSGVIELTAADIHTRYSLSYGNMSDTNGSWWASGAVSTTFVEGQTVTLPAASAVSRSGYIFLGWYESEDFSGEAVSSFTAGSEGKTVYARWATPDLYVAAGGSNANSGLSATAPLATVAAALEKLAAFASEQGNGFDWTLHISGTISESDILIMNLKAASLTICGSSADSDCIDGESRAAIISCDGSVPVTIASLTLKNGAASGETGGGAVSMDLNTLTLSDCILSSNSAARGGAVYIGSGGTLVLSGTTVIPSETQASKDNDVYLSAGTSLSVSGTLSASSLVACITPEAYTAGKQLLSGDYATDSNYGKFAVTPDSDGGSWTIDSNGCLQSVSASSSPVSTLSAAPTSGTYSLSTLAELQRLQTWVNTDGESLSGVTFVMSADIDLGGSEWTPIGTSSTDYYFSGNFDGGGYEFQNYVPSTSHTYSGIFGVVSATDSDESVKIANVSVSGTGSLKSTGGGIVGLARGSGTVTIDSCVSDVDIAYSGSGTVRFGGIVGYCSASAGTLVIQNCVNYGSISCSGSGQLYAGGIIGRASGGTTTIINCANFGAITSSATTTCYLAGISAAITTNGKITVSQCVNAGAISAAAGTPYALANTDGATSATVQYSFYLSGCASSVTNAATTSNCSAFTVSEGQNHIATAVSYGTASYGTDSSATVILNAIAADSTDLLSWENVSDSSSNFYGCPRLVGL